MVLLHRDALLAEFNEPNVGQVIPLQKHSTGYKSIIELPGDYTLLCFNPESPFRVHPIGSEKNRDSQLALMNKKTLDIMWRSDKFCSDYPSIGQNANWNILYRESQSHCSEFAPNLLLFDQPSGKLVNSIAIEKPNLSHTLTVLHGERLYLGNRNTFACLSLPDLVPIWHEGSPIQVDQNLEEMIEELKIPAEWVQR